MRGGIFYTVPGNPMLPFDLRKEPIAKQILASCLPCFYEVGGAEPRHPHIVYAGVLSTACKRFFFAFGLCSSCVGTESALQAVLLGHFESCNTFGGSA